MAGNWFAIGKLQGFAREHDGAFVSFAAAAAVWGQEEACYLFVPEFYTSGDRVLFVPGAVENAIREYGLPRDQAKVNSICERAMTADLKLVAEKQAEMDARDRAELGALFPCPDRTRVGIGRASPHVQS
jgi:hypothetical protein